MILQLIGYLVGNQFVDEGLKTTILGWQSTTANDKNVFHIFPVLVKV